MYHSPKMYFSSFFLPKKAKGFLFVLLFPYSNRCFVRYVIWTMRGACAPHNYEVSSTITTLRYERTSYSCCFQCGGSWHHIIASQPIHIVQRWVSIGIGITKWRRRLFCRFIATSFAGCIARVCMAAKGNGNLSVAIGNDRMWKPPS